MDATKEFKILSIDGGGIKGLYSSTILEHLEDKFKCRLADYFDLICGTSTGGLIALALSLKIPAQEISALYSEKGSTIFPKRGKWRQYVWGGKYDEKPLKDALIDVFGDRTLSESNNLLCIPSYSITDGRPWVFKYDHPEGNLNRDNKAKYVDVALATSAAPTYFPVTEIPYYDSKQFVDGGVWANNPTYVGVIEALRYFVGEGKEFDLIRVLSISSLEKANGIPTGSNRYKSFIKWKQDLFDTFLTGQSSFNDYIMSIVGKISSSPVEYVRIPSEIISSKHERLVQMDLATPEALKLLKGKGNDRGLIAAKDPDIARFFSQTKLTTLRNGK